MAQQPRRLTNRKLQRQKKKLVVQEEAVKATPKFSNEVRTADDGESIAVEESVGREAAGR